MAKWRENIKKWMVNQLDLPTDAVMDLPRITMIGQFHIYIENHQGVLRFSSEELRLKLNEGQLHVKGSGFVIKTILPEEILLEGTVHYVQFNK